MRTSALLLALAWPASATSPASAQIQVPARNSVQPDSRVRKIVYDPDVVTVVSTRPDFETMISFSAAEKIQNVAIGDSTSWQVVPNKLADLLFVKPLSTGAHTNMAVVTDSRTYFFDLRSDDGAGPLMYSLRFIYPDSGLPKVVASATTGITTPWQASGTPALRPARAYDDGKSVFIYWPKPVALPALLAVDERGSEEPITFTARGDYLVTEGVPVKLVVRVGAKQAILAPKAERNAPYQIAGR